MVSSRTHLHVAVARHDRHGGERAEMPPEGGVHAQVFTGDDLHDGEALAPELELVRPQTETRLDE
jgi:hypothetical protein